MKVFLALLLAISLIGCGHSPLPVETEARRADKAVSCSIGSGIYAVRSILIKRGLMCSRTQRKPFKKFLVLRLPSPCVSFNIAKSASCHAVVGYYFRSTGPGSYEGCLHRVEGCDGESCKTSWKIILTRRR